MSEYALNADADAVEDDEKKLMDVGGRRLLLCSNRRLLGCYVICFPRVESHLISPFSRAGVREDPTQLHYASRQCPEANLAGVLRGVSKAQPETAPLTICSIHRSKSHISPHRPVSCLSQPAHRRHKPVSVEV